MKGQVHLCFEVLSGNKPISSANNFMGADFQQTFTNTDNLTCKKTEHWVKWWRREHILRMFCSAFTEHDGDEWDATLSTINPKESLNREKIFN